MRFSKVVVLPLVAISPAVMGQDISSIISEAGGEASSLISKYGGGDVSSLIASASSAYESVLSSLSKHPEAVSSIESVYSSLLPSKQYASFTSALGSILPDSGNGDGGNAGAVIAPSYGLTLMGAAAAGIFGLAVAL